MNNETKNNSNLPLIIIGAVLLAAIAGGWYFYQNSKSAPVKTAVNANKKDDSSFLKTYQNAPPGAQPPNMLGSASAQVTVEEFADFQCPTCAAVHGKMKEINAVYGSRIKFIYRSFPLTQIHKNGYDAAVAAESAGMQGKYWDMQNQLFTNQTAWANSDNARKMFEDYAQKIGLDAEKFQNDMLGIATKGRVDADMARGRALGVNGTPTIYINGKPLAFEQFDVTPIRQVIDAELQKTQAGQINNQSQTNSANVSAANSNSVNK
jgi:protein-disulfide isomerase